MFTALRGQGLATFLLFFARDAKGGGGAGFETAKFDVFSAFFTLTESAVFNALHRFIDFFQIKNFAITEAHSHRLFNVGLRLIELIETIVIGHIELFTHDARTAERRQPPTHQSLATDWRGNGEPAPVINGCAFYDDWCRNLVPGRLPGFPEGARKHLHHDAPCFRSPGSAVTKVTRLLGPNALVHFTLYWGSVADIDEGTSSHRGGDLGLCLSDSVVIETEGTNQ